MPGFALITKQVPDSGVDARTLADKPVDFNSRLALAQIKGGRINLSSLRDSIGVVNGNKAAIEFLVTLNPVRPAEAQLDVANVGKITVRGCEYRRM